MTQFWLFLFAAFVTFVWALRLKQSVQFFSGPHLIDRFSREALTFPVTKVSVIIPARNEEKNIGRCLESLLKQDYPDYEVIVVDDRSTDKTAAIVKNLQSEHPNLVLLPIEELSSGWTGKNHALHQGVALAKGGWFLFTDADTVHAEASLSKAVGHAIRRKADMLTLTPSLENKSFWEKVIQPVAGGVLMLRFPIQQVNDPTSRRAFGNGQYILIKREVYEKIGGHERVKDFMLEDIALAKCVKQEGFHLHLGYGADLFKTRMYSTLSSLWHGWTRIYYSAFDKNLFVLFSLMCLIWLVSLSPYILLLLSLYLLVAQNLSFFSIFFFGIVLFQYFLIFPALVNTYTISRSDTSYIIYHGLACLVVFAILTNAFLKILLNHGVHWSGHSYIEKAR